MPFVNLQSETTTFSPNLPTAGSPTTIVWGTDGLYSGYIVISAREETRVEEIDIMQGAGFTAIVVLLYDGNNVELTVVDDTAVNPPAIGAIVSVLSPFGAIINALVVNNGTDQERKREGHRTLSIKSYNAISGVR